jgi:tetratricopeptide (TPR) repeat protein
MSAADDEAERAYAHDREGREHEAVAHYEAAHRLGGPSRERAGFLLGYGSTLRNVGRLDESLAVLRAAVEEHPDHHALRCFLALTLHSLGRHGEAMAAMMDVALALRAGSPSITRFARALEEYRDLL